MIYPLKPNRKLEDYQGDVGAIKELVDSEANYKWARNKQRVPTPKCENIKSNWSWRALFANFKI